MLQAPSAKRLRVRPREDNSAYYFDENEERAGESDSTDIRKELRVKYRRMIEELQESSNRQISEITKGIMEANILYKQVQMPREAALDSEYFRSVSEESEKKVAELHIGLKKKKTIEGLTMKLRKIIGLNEESFGIIDTPKLWEDFGKKSIKFFKRTPPIQILGHAPAIQVSEKPKKARKRADTLAKKVTAEAVSNANDEGNDQETTKKIEKLKEYLEEQRDIDFLKLVTDKNSFSKTIENIFYLTFLVRDGFAKIVNVAERGKADFRVLTQKQPTDQEKEFGLAPSWQFVWQMDYELWKKAVEYVENRKDEDAEPLNLNDE